MSSENTFNPAAGEMHSNRISSALVKQMRVCLLMVVRAAKYAGLSTDREGLHDFASKRYSVLVDSYLERQDMFGAEPFFHFLEEHVVPALPRDTDFTKVALLMATMPSKTKAYVPMNGKQLWDASTQANAHYNTYAGFWHEALPGGQLPSGLQYDDILEKVRVAALEKIALEKRALRKRALPKGTPPRNPPREDDEDDEGEEDDEDGQAQARGIPPGFWAFIALGPYAQGKYGAPVSRFTEDPKEQDGLKVGRAQLREEAKPKKDGKSSSLSDAVLQLVQSHGQHVERMAAQQDRAQAQKERSQAQKERASRQQALLILLGQATNRIDRLMEMIRLPGASAAQVQDLRGRIEVEESKSEAMEKEMNDLSSLQLSATFAGSVASAALVAASLPTSEGNAVGEEEEEEEVAFVPTPSKKQRRSGAELAEHQLKTANDNVALAVANLERLTSVDSTRLTPAKTRDHQAKVAKAQTKKEGADLALAAAQEKYSAARLSGEEA